MCKLNILDSVEQPILYPIGMFVNYAVEMKFVFGIRQFVKKWPNSERLWYQHNW